MIEALPPVSRLPESPIGRPILPLPLAALDFARQLAAAANGTTSGLFDKEIPDVEYPDTEAQASQ